MGSSIAGRGSVNSRMESRSAIYRTSSCIVTFSNLYVSAKKIRDDPIGAARKYEESKPKRETSLVRFLFRLLHCNGGANLEYAYIRREFGVKTPNSRYHFVVMS